MPGIQDFTRFNIGKETVRGTPVAPTRQMYGEGTGVLEPDFGLRFHEAENRARRSIVGPRATSQAEDVALGFRTSEGVSFDDMVWPLSQLKGGMTGIGAGADKTWTATPSVTAANNPESFSIDVGDDVQNWRVQYAMMPSWRLRSAIGQLTELEAKLFGQRAVKTVAATPGSNVSPKIPGDLWTIKVATTFAGLAGAAVQTNWLRSLDLEVITGLIWRHYQDGNAYGAQHVETSIGGSLKLTVESTALTITEAYDKLVAQTQDYVRLKTTGIALGASNYSLQFDVPILWRKVPIISGEDAGVNLYDLEANINDDGTNVIAPTLVTAAAALP